MKRGKKKKPDHSSCPVQRKTIGKEKDLYTQGNHHFLQHDHITT